MRTKPGVNQHLRHGADHLSSPKMVKSSTIIEACKATHGRCQGLYKRCHERCSRQIPPSTLLFHGAAIGVGVIPPRLLWAQCRRSLLIAVGRKEFVTALTRPGMFQWRASSSLAGSFRHPATVIISLRTLELLPYFYATTASSERQTDLCRFVIICWIDAQVEMVEAIGKEVLNTCYIISLQYHLTTFYIANFWHVSNLGPTASRS